MQIISSKLARKRSPETETAFSGDADSEAKALACACAAGDKKAENIKLLNLSGLSGFTDYFLICEGTSDKQVKAIADSVFSVLKSAGHPPISMEGYVDGRWILIDFGDVVVHVFLNSLREYYDLESLWAHAPRVKVP